MLISAFFSWWYGAGWKQLASSFKPRLETVAELFSVDQISRTLFAPWRRIITYPGVGLSERFKAWGDNIFSRVIGFVVRLSVLFTAVITLLIVAIITTVQIVLWPIIPVAPLIALVLGLAL